MPTTDETPRAPARGWSEVSRQRLSGWASLTRTSSGSGRLLAVDGYRGAFVTLVLLYHFGVEQLVGGWVGINHFFVFSGYLITRILLSERARYGSLDVLGFYRRRAERLLPALLALLAAVLVYAVLFTGPGQRHQTAGDAVASLFFVQNWRLIARGDSYFDMLGDPSPLRHLWTLGVEEQFYVLIPALVLVVFALVRGRWSRLSVVLALLALSVAWTAWLASGDQLDFARLYYGTDTRAQALLGGVAIGIALGRDDRGQVGPRPSVAVLQGLGLLGTAISVLAFFVVDVDSAWLFTHGGMMVFTAGAVLMVLAATDPRPMALNRWVAWPPLVALGQMTYGLYIYHWPIHLWVGPHLNALPLALSVVLQLALTVVVAALSFRFLEVPVTKRGLRGLLPRVGRHHELRVAVAAVAAVATAATAVYLTNPAGRGPLGDTATPTAPSPAVAPGAVTPLVPGQPEYVEGKPGVVGTYGDSVAYFLADRFPVGAFPGASVVNVSVEGCDLLDAPITIVPGVDGQNREQCTDLKQTWDTTLEEQGADTLLVVISPLLAMPHQVDGKQIDLGDEQYRSLITDRLDEMVERAQGAGVEQVAVANVPCRELDTTQVPAVVRLFGEKHPDLLREYKNPKQINALLGRWAERHDDVDLLDLYGAVCGDDPVESVDGHPLYNDYLHFSPEATPTVWSWLLGEMSRAREARG